LVPSACAIAGSDVEITVESMFSMNNAVATISGTIRSEGGDSILGGYRLLEHDVRRLYAVNTLYANLMQAASPLPRPGRDQNIA